MVHKTQRNISLARVTVYYKRILKGMNQQPDEKIHKEKSWTKELLWWMCLGSGSGDTEVFWFLNMKAPPKAIKKLSFLGFYGDFITLSWLTKSLTKGNWFNLWPLHVPQKWETWSGDGGGTESSNPLNTWSVVLATSPMLEWNLNVNFPEVFSGAEDKRPNIPLLLLLRKFQGFGELWMKTKHILFL